MKKTQDQILDDIIAILKAAGIKSVVNPSYIYKRINPASKDWIMYNSSEQIVGRWSFAQYASFFRVNDPIEKQWIQMEPGGIYLRRDNAPNEVRIRNGNIYATNGNQAEFYVEPGSTFLQVLLRGLPTSVSAGTPSGMVWCDSNGYLRITP